MNHQIILLILVRHKKVGVRFDIRKNLQFGRFLVPTRPKSALPCTSVILNLAFTYCLFPPFSIVEHRNKKLIYLIFSCQKLNCQWKQHLASLVQPVDESFAVGMKSHLSRSYSDSESISMGISRPSFLDIHVPLWRWNMRISVASKFWRLLEKNI